MRRILVPLVVAALLSGVPVALAQADENTQKSPEELVSEGIQTLVQAMELFLKSVPQFGKPYLNDNGDIVVPRLRPEAEKPEDPIPVPDGQRRI